MKRRARAIGRPTKAQQARQDAQRLHGCAMCHLRGCAQPNQTEIHHLTTGDLHGQKQRGQDFTVGLCGWHHRGDPRDFESYGGACRIERDMRNGYGPSFALHKRAFMDELSRALGERSMEALMRWQDSRIGNRRAA